MRVNPHKNGSAYALFLPIITNSLCSGKNVLFIKRAIQRRAPMT